MRANDSARRDPIALLVVGAVLLACCATAAIFERIDPIQPRHLVAWRNADDARRIAAATKRPMLFAFVRERDVESSRFEHELFADPALGARINRDFAAVRVVDVRNTGRTNPPFVTALLSQFGVHRLPALVVADAEGTRHEVLGRHRLRADTIAFLDTSARLVMSRKPASRDEARRAQIAALANIGGATSPTLSPNGTRVAFVADLSGQPQLWAMDVEDGYPQLVASHDEGIHAAQWSPNGAWIAFAAGTRSSQIYVVRPDGRDLRQVTTSTGRNLMTSWTDDSRLPVHVARRTSPGMESLLYDPATSTSRIVATHPQFGIVLDVDGERMIVLRRDGARRTTWIRSGTAMRELASHVDDEQTLAFFGKGSILEITNRGRDRSVLLSGNDVLWSRDDAELVGGTLTPDRTRAALLWNRAGRQELGLIDLRTGKREVGPLPAGVIGGLSFSADGMLLAFSGSDARQPSDIWLLDVRTKEVRQLTRSGHAGVDLTKLVPPELVRFRGAGDLELAGWLYRAAKPGRAVISLHGGPAQQETPALRPAYQALVAAGISVFAPNIRGSYGFGRRFTRLDDRELREDAIADVKAAADLLVQQGIATKIGVMGESYGGWLALAVASRHPERFAAAVDQYGMLDLTRMIDEAAPEVAPMLRAEWGDARTLERYSIDRKALRTPTLVLHGAHDTIVSPWHSNETVAALRANKVPVEYIVFPDEGHGWRKAPNRVRAAEAITSWFDRWL
jgi:dipeptidyl aminopeptidase/acylaminoacyl peptidase